MHRSSKMLFTTKNHKNITNSAGSSTTHPGCADLLAPGSNHVHITTARKTQCPERSSTNRNTGDCFIGMWNTVLSLNHTILLVFVNLISANGYDPKIRVALFTMYSCSKISLEAPIGCVFTFLTHEATALKNHHVKYGYIHIKIITDDLKMNRGIFKTVHRFILASDRL